MLGIDPGTADEDDPWRGRRPEPLGRDRSRMANRIATADREFRDHPSRHEVTLCLRAISPVDGVAIGRPRLFAHVGTWRESGAIARAT